MHTNSKPNTTANPNAEGDSAVQVRGRTQDSFQLRTTAPNGEKNVTVFATGVRENKKNDMPKYVRLEFGSYPLSAQNLMTPDEARTLARHLIKAAQFADMETEGGN